MAYGPLADPNGTLNANAVCVSCAPSAGGSAASANASTGGTLNFNAQGAPCPSCPPGTTAIQTCGGITIIGSGGQLPCPLIPMPAMSG